MPLLSLLTKPPIMVTLLVTQLTTITGLSMKVYSQYTELQRLKDTLITTHQELNRCQTNLAVIQSDLTRQAQEISRYNSLASRYQKELETKYVSPSPANQPCEYDFTIINNLLTRQGARS